MPNRSPFDQTSRTSVSNPIEEINKHSLDELFDRAEDYKNNTHHAMRQNDRELALIYATLYQAENTRILSFLTEMQVRGEKF